MLRFWLLLLAAVAVSLCVGRRSSFKALFMKKGRPFPLTTRNPQGCVLSPETFTTSKIYVADSEHCTKITAKLSSPPQRRPLLSLEDSTLSDPSLKLSSLEDSVTKNLRKQFTHEQGTADAIAVILKKYAKAGYTVPELVRVPCLQLWARDAAKLGFVPGKKEARCAVTFSARGGYSQFKKENFADNDDVSEFASKDVGPMKIEQTSTNHQAGGNVLILPPSKNYPNGRVLMGSNDATSKLMEESSGVFKHFFQQKAELTAAIYQPIDEGVDVSWLSVGHVDEVISVVPTDPPVFLIPKLIPSDKPEEDAVDEDELEEDEEEESGLQNSSRTTSPKRKKVSPETELFQNIWRLLASQTEEVTKAKSGERENELARLTSEHKLHMTEFQKNIDKMEKQTLQDSVVVKLPMTFYVRNKSSFPIAASSHLSPNPINHLALRLGHKKGGPSSDGDEKILHILLTAAEPSDEQVALSKEWQRIITGLKGDHDVEFIRLLGDASGGIHCMTLEEKDQPLPVAVEEDLESSSPPKSLQHDEVSGVTSLGLSAPSHHKERAGLGLGLGLGRSSPPKLQSDKRVSRFGSSRTTVTKSPLLQSSDRQDPEEDQIEVERLKKEQLEVERLKQKQLEEERLKKEKAEKLQNESGF